MKELELPRPASPDKIRRLPMRLYTENFSMQTVIVPPFGYLEGLEMRFREIVPNFDASMPYQIQIGGVHGGAWPLPGFDMYAICREILYPNEQPMYYDKLGQSSIQCPHCEKLLILSSTVEVAKP